LLAAGNAAAVRMRPAAIDRSRAQYITTIATFRQLTHETNAFIEKAQRLLTTHWAPASWAARAEILRTVDWLVRLGTSQPAPHGPRASQASRT
jgi:hypothetical protein